MKAKHNENQAKKDKKVARDEEKKQKKAINVATVVTRGARVLHNLELYGKGQLLNMAR